MICKETLEISKGHSQPPGFFVKKNHHFKSRQITKLELARVLARHGFEWQSKQVRDSIFDRLLSDKPKMRKSEGRRCFFCKTFLFCTFWNIIHFN